MTTSLEQAAKEPTRYGLTLRELIKNMKEKNFREEIILEEVEKFIAQTESQSVEGMEKIKEALKHIYADIKRDGLMEQFGLDENDYIAAALSLGKIGHQEKTANGHDTPNNIDL